MKTEKDCEINKNRPDLKTKKEKLSKSPSSSSKNNSNKKIVEVVSKEKNYKPPNLIPTNFEKTLRIHQFFYRQFETAAI